MNFGKADLPEGHTDLQKDYNSLDRWADKNLITSISRAKPCTWEGTIPGTSICWELPTWKEALRMKGLGSSGKDPIEQETAMYP